MNFSFVGQISTSKSLLNRALILKSHAPELKFEAQSTAEDVRLMQEALEQLKLHNSNEVTKLSCGHAGTVLRFLALRVAREKGRFRLSGSERLFSRPLDELVKILRQLGSYVEVGSNFLDIECDGWRLMGDQLYLPSDKSSQFASAFLLNAWNLPFEVFFRTSTEPASEAYFLMTWEMVKELGMKIKVMGMKIKVMGSGEFHISSHQQITTKSLTLEPDMSSAFAVAACATVAGELRLKNWPDRSLQPDVRFIEILKEMGVTPKVQNHTLSLSQAKHLRPVDVNIKDSPDLFPVLAVLCSLADGESTISGIENLIYKESNRSANIHALLKLLGVDCSLTANEFKVRGRGRNKWNCAEIEFDPDQDHRMFMAAQVLRWAGAPLRVLHPEVVDKSFPEFKELILH